MEFEAFRLVDRVETLALAERRIAMHGEVPTRSTILDLCGGWSGPMFASASISHSPRSCCSHSCCVVGCVCIRGIY